MKKLIATTLLLSSFSCFADLPKKSIEEYCHMGDKIGLATRGWKNLNPDDPAERMCASEYKDISPEDGLIMANNISVYLTGNSASVHSIKLIANINNPKYKNISISEVEKAVEHYVKTIKNASVDMSLIKSRIAQLKNGSFQIGALTVSVEYEPWPKNKNKGFSINVLIN